MLPMRLFATTNIRRIPKRKEWQFTADDPLARMYNPFAVSRSIAFTASSRILSTSGFEYRLRLQHATEPPGNLTRRVKDREERSDPDFRRSICRCTSGTVPARVACRIVFTSSVSIWTLMPDISQRILDHLSVLIDVAAFPELYLKIIGSFLYPASFSSCLAFAGSYLYSVPGV